MILRRIKAHVEKENWFAVFLDFCIVVIGVFVGLQVANWNEGRAEDRRERTYLERLDKEFDVVEFRVNRSISMGQTRTHAVETMLKAWEVGPTAFDSPDAKGPGVRFIEIMANVVPPNPPAAFQELVSSGELSIIDSEALRTALYEFDALCDVAHSAYETTTNDMRQLRELMSSAYIFDSDTLYDQFLVGRDGEDRGPQSIQGVFIPDAFFDNPEFRHALNGASVAIINMRVLAEQQQAMLERINVLIDEELTP